MSDELWLERLAAATRDEPRDRAPARLKSKVYSAVVARLAEGRPLLDLATTKQAGGHLCVFEHMLTMVPSASLRSMNPCRICHARVLAEGMEHAPIFWPGCPYAEFHRG